MKINHIIKLKNMNILKTPAKNWFEQKGEIK